MCYPSSTYSPSKGVPRSVAYPDTRSKVNVYFHRKARSIFQSSEQPYGKLSQRVASRRVVDAFINSTVYYLQL